MSKEEYGAGYKGWSKAIQELGSVPAIANKATEEGELPELPHTTYNGYSDGSEPLWTKEQMHGYATQAIAADRASRQVANKAEVEKAAAWIDQFGNVFPLGAYSPTGKPNYLDADKRGWKPLFRATPPATTGGANATPTGASTGWQNLSDAQWKNIVNHDNSYEDYSKGDAILEAVKLTEDKLKELNVGSASASTALTDERIIDCFTKAGVWLGIDKDRIAKNITAVRIALVAAQAGQVAVPEDRQALASEVLAAAQYYADCHYEDGANRGKGGPGFGKKTSRAEGRLMTAVSALAAAPAAPVQAKPLPTAEVPAPAAPKQCWSLNDEGFSHDSLSELLDNYPDLKAGAQVFTGMAVYPALSRLIDSDDVIDQMGDRAYDIAGEYADGYPDVSAEDKAELDALLEGWIKKACSPDFYEVRDVHTYVITEQDIAAQASTPDVRSQEGGDCG